MARFDSMETLAGSLYKLFNETPRDSECMSSYASRFLSTLITQWHYLTKEQIAIVVILVHASKIEPRLQQLAFTTEINTRLKLQQGLMALTYRKGSIQDRNNLLEDQKGHV